MKRYEWLPSECAPLKYPVQILRGDFILDDGEFVSIPDGKLVYNGWGNIGSTYLVGDAFKTLPNSLAIVWFSFLEDKFYAGVFSLPKNKIEGLFDKGYVSPNTGEYKTFDRILVGLAPRGGISIWLMGERVIKEVIFMHAEKVEIDWIKFVRTQYPREKYIQMKLNQVFSDEDLKKIKERGIPIGVWDRKYRLSFDWQPWIISTTTPKKISLCYFNAERECYDLLSDENWKKMKRTVPKELGINWEASSGERLYSKIDFDEEEIFLAFAKIYNEQDPQEIKMQIEISEVDYSSKLFLRNNKYILELKKCSTKVFAA